MTVSFDVAASRIRNLFQDLDKDYEKHFDELKKIRNSLIHFDYLDNKNKELSIESISKTWYYLHYLLNVKWKDVFIDYQNEIEKINKKLEQYSDYFWNSKKIALKKNKNKYANDPQYTPINIHNKPLTCAFCNKSYDIEDNLSLLRMTFDNETYTLTMYCDVCEQEDNLFLFSLYLQKNKSIAFIKSEFKNFINKKLWQFPGNNTVNHSHYKRLKEATLEEINVDFEDIFDLSYENFAIDCKSVGKIVQKLN